MKIIIAGFGRMGVSHAFQIFGALGSEVKLTIVDPSFLARIISKVLLPARRYHKTLNDVGENDFDYGILCTPPYDRQTEVAQISAIAKLCLIEKPVLTVLPKNAMSGYVMQYCPTATYVSEIIGKLSLEVTEIDISVYSNVDFSLGQSGWRSEGKAGGLLYEFFGHALTFGLCPLLSASEFTLSDISVVKSERNQFDMTLKVGKTLIRCQIHGDSNVRKTRYLCVYKTSGARSIEFDPYSVKIDGGVVNIPDIAGDIRFFLRAYEFSIQCDRLISGSRDQMGSNGIRNIEQLLEELV